MKEEQTPEVQAKELWTTPELVVHGDARKLTLHIPRKIYGTGDGATWNGQDVTWAGS
jgi:hypothetical protein